MNRKIFNLLSIDIAKDVLRWLGITTYKYDIYIDGEPYDLHSLDIIILQQIQHKLNESKKYKVYDILGLEFPGV